jgi:tetratricopeptide (TPR) repeat protein
MVIMEVMLPPPPLELEVTPTPKEIGRRTYFEASSRKRAQIDLLNQVARARAQLVKASKLRPLKFVRELEREAHRYGLELTPIANKTVAELFAWNGEHDSALRYYQRAWAHDSDAFAGLVDLGAAYGRIGQFRISLTFLQRANAKKPGNPRVLNNLGATLHALGQDKEALEAFKKAREIDPTYATPLLNEGNLRCNSGDHQFAIRLFRQALAIPSRSPIAFMLSGFCFMELGRHQEALEAFENAASEGIDDPPVHLNRSSALVALGRIAEAQLALKKFLHHSLAAQWLRIPAIREMTEKLHTGIESPNNERLAAEQMRSMNRRQSRQGVASVRSSLLALRNLQLPEGGKRTSEPSSPKATGDASDVV